MNGVLYKIYILNFESIIKRDFDSLPIFSTKDSSTFEGQDL